MSSLLNTGMGRVEPFVANLGYPNLEWETGQGGNSALSRLIKQGKAQEIAKIMNKTLNLKTIYVGESSTSDYYHVVINDLGAFNEALSRYEESRKKACEAMRTSMISHIAATKANADPLAALVEILGYPSVPWKKETDHYKSGPLLESSAQAIAKSITSALNIQDGIAQAHSNTETGEHHVLISHAGDNSLFLKSLEIYTVIMKNIYEKMESCVVSPAVPTEENPFPLTNEEFDEVRNLIKENLHPEPTQFLWIEKVLNPSAESPQTPQTISIPTLHSIRYNFDSKTCSLLAITKNINNVSQHTHFFLTPEQVRALIKVLKRNVNPLTQEEEKTIASIQSLTMEEEEKNTITSIQSLTTELGYPSVTWKKSKSVTLEDYVSGALLPNTAKAIATSITLALNIKLHRGTVCISSNAETEEHHIIIKPTPFFTEALNAYTSKIRGAYAKMEATVFRPAVAPISQNSLPLTEDEYNEARKLIIKNLFTKPTQFSELKAVLNSKALVIGIPTLYAITYDPNTGKCFLLFVEQQDSGSAEVSHNTLTPEQVRALIKALK